MYIGYFFILYILFKNFFQQGIIVYMDSSLNDRALVEKARHDPEAFSVIFERYYDALFSFALRRTGNVALAEDVVAETFLKAFDKLWQFKWTGAPFSSWLYRIAGNEINMYFRKKSNVNHSLESMLEADASLEPADRTDLQEELIEAEETYERTSIGIHVVELLSLLPEHYREALSLRYLEEKSVAEVARFLGKPEGTVKSLLSRGIGKLRELVESQPERASSILKISEDASI